MPKPVHIALVNDYEIVLEGLRRLLGSSEPEIRIVEIDLKRRPRKSVDVTLVDTYGEIEALESRVRTLVADPSNGGIVAFSFSDQPGIVRRALRAGAQGFISKAAPADQIIEAIWCVANGERAVVTQRSQRGAVDEALGWPGRDVGLTVRESELLALLPTGMTNRELAAKFFVSENTIKTQLRSLYKKLDIRTRAQAASFANQGILGTHQPRTELVD